jgi:hypothetical protein
MRGLFAAVAAATMLGALSPALAGQKNPLFQLVYSPAEDAELGISRNAVQGRRNRLLSRHHYVIFRTHRYPTHHVRYY